MYPLLVGTLLFLHMNEFSLLAVLPVTTNNNKIPRDPKKNAVNPLRGLRKPNKLHQSVSVRPEVDERKVCVIFARLWAPLWGTWNFIHELVGSTFLWRLDCATLGYVYRAKVT